MKKKIIKLLFAMCIALALIVFFVKINTNIYVGNYSWDCCSIDIQIKVNDKQLLNDSLACNPYMINYQLQEKLKYGFHTVQISSKKANIKQEKRIFLMPNQHIYIEFFSADTLCLEERMRAKEAHPFSMSKSSNQIDTVSLGLDTIKVIENEASIFFIESRFNPFYLE